MSAREKILNAVKTNKPALTALPAIESSAVITYDDLLQQYKKTLESIGGSCLLADSNEEVLSIIREESKNKQVVIDTIGSNVDNLSQLGATSLANVDMAILKGTVAVAENAAIWLSEEQMVNRLLPFICQQLIIVIHKKDIVATMHQAYAVTDIRSTGFGVFIAGPSKTADIEQSLVIGAHGPVGLKVIIQTN
jgi:L-lactate dehydrogenase complex protein LldG